MGQYSFEADSRSAFQYSIRDAERDFLEFVERLSTPPLEAKLSESSPEAGSTEPASAAESRDQSAKIDDEQEALLRAYVRVNHGAAKWYHEERKRRRRWLRWYAVVSITALMAIPVLIYWLTGAILEVKVDGSTTFNMKPDPDVWAAQIAAVATGLLAAQRAVSAWLGQTQAANNFSKAASEFKAKIYSFEGEWQGRVFGDNAVATEAAKALRKGIREAREIVQKQRDEYFARSAPPKAATDAGKLFDAFKSPAFAAAVKQDKAEATKLAEIAKLQGEITTLVAENAALGDLIKTKEGELNDLSDGDPRTTQLQSFLKTLRGARDTNEKTLATKTVKFSALLYPRTSAT